MVNLCCVALCQNNTKTPNISMHKFTKNPKLFKVWLHLIKRDTKKSKRNPRPFKVTKYTKICSAHFLKSDFIIGSERNKLKPEASPSVFPWSNTKMNRLQRKRSTIRRKMHTEQQTDCLIINNQQFVTVNEDINEVISVPFTERTEENEQVVNEDIMEVTSVPAIEQTKENEQVVNVDRTEIISEPSTSGSNVEESALQISSYCDLVKYNDLRKKCKCNEVIITYNKSTNVAFDVTDMQKQVYAPLKQKVPLFSIDMFKTNDSDMMHYTGFANYDLFKICFNMVFANNNMYKSNCSILNLENSYFLVLMKLRRGFTLHHLSHLFSISISTVSNVFVYVINVMYLRLGSLNIWPHRNVLYDNFQKEFKDKYKNVLGSLDATELYIQTPSSLVIQSQTYSQYKHNNTLKGLVVIDANGAIIFVSALFTGSISDNALLKKSGFINVVQKKLEKGYLLKSDTFLADKGFTSQELLQYVNINIPVFKMNNLQFTPAEVKITQTIAHERIHVERAIGRIKNFKIFSSEIPLACMGTINQIWTVCCLLTNFQMPLRKYDSEL